MPFKDHTGTRCGSLVLLRKGTIKPYNGKNTIWYWVRCEICGRELLISYRRISMQKMKCCPTCKRDPCVICGGRIPDSRKQSNRCSEQCAQLRQEEIRGNYYAKKKFEDPNYTKGKYKKIKERILTDPEFAENYKKKRDIFNKKYREENQEKIAQYREDYKQRNKEFIRNQKTLYRESLTDEEKEKRLHYLREYHKKRLEEIKEDQKEYEKYLNERREILIEHRRKKELAELLSASQKLQEKIKNERE